MPGFPWLQYVESYMVQQLLRTPAFHRAVGKVAKGVRWVRDGAPMDEMGGVKLDQPRESSFAKHFTAELKQQLGAAERREASAIRATETPKTTADTRQGNPSTRAAVKDASEGSDAAWQNVQKSPSEAPRQGFMGEYMEALRGQIRNQQK